MNAAAIVRTNTASYDVYVEPGSLESLGNLLSQQAVSRRAFIVSDHAIWAAWGDPTRRSIESAGFAAEVLLVESGEHSKSIGSVQDLLDRLIAAGAERRHPVIALGGGVIGDLAGFVAAIYLRGVPFAQVPTSLLAMADAAIGGKTGVNHPSGKNLVGAFHQPLFVLEDPRLLATMPEREFKEGWAEIIKHGLILDNELLDNLLQDRDSLALRDEAALTRVLAASARVKASVVSADEREANKRTWLNYGHTVAHALEAAAGYGRYLHGEAVAIGLVAAARIGAELDLLTDHEFDRHCEVLRAYGLPLRAEGVTRGEILQAMTHDKKREDDRQRWVLLEGLTQPVIRSDIPDRLVDAALREVGIE